MSNRIPTTNPDYEAGAGVGSIVDTIEKQAAVEVDTASGAIAIKEGTVILNGAGALAMTLVAPTAGMPSAGGDDGKRLTIIAATSHAHTVTTPANKINGADDTVTYATAGQAATLVAYNGVWYATVLTGATLSEV